MSALFFASTSLAQKSDFSGKSIKINQLKKQKPEKGVFITQGFIIKNYVCLPCPPKVYCKPCMGNKVVLSEENKRMDNYNLTEKELIIFTSEAKKLIRGKKYRVKIRITDRKSTGDPINNIYLISYKLIS